MRTVVQRRYGGPELLDLEGVPRPSIGAHEVLVQVHAVGVDRGTCHLLTGLPYLLRLIGFGLRRPKQPVPGLDVAGVVVATRPSVTRFRPGDEVHGIARGAFADLAAAAEEHKLARKPPGLSFAEAGHGPRLRHDRASGGARRRAPAAGPLRLLRRLLAPGTLVLVGSEQGGRLTGGLTHTCAPLDRAADALRHLGAGHVRGKAAVTLRCAAGLEVPR